MEVIRRDGALTVAAMATRAGGGEALRRPSMQFTPRSCSNAPARARISTRVPGDLRSRVELGEKQELHQLVWEVRILAPVPLNTTQPNF